MRWLIGIVVVAFILRIFQINLPVLGDEAEFGYSAYSIMKTGKNQYNQSNPFLFTTSYDKYPALYSYTTIPFIALLGLNAVSERIPSILFGSLSCVLIYLLVVLLFQSKSAGLVSAAFLAINPWALYYSRQGRFEMIGIFLVLLGVVSFLYALKSKRWQLSAVSAISFGLSLHANDSTKIVVPLLIAGLFFLYRNHRKTHKKQLVVFISLFAVFLLLLVKVLFVDGQVSDYTRLSLVQRSAISDVVNWQRRTTSAPLWASTLFHNKATVFAEQYLSSYLNIFSLNWLFFTGQGSPQESLGRFGQYMLFELPFFFIGAYLTFRKKIAGAFLLFWLMIANIPGSVTTGNFNPYRSILLLPVPLLYSGLGFVWFWKRTNRFVRLMSIGICTLFSLSFLFSLYFDYPVYASEWRGKERIDALEFARSQENNYEKIYVSGRFEVAYAFIAQLDPKIFQQSYEKKTTYRSVPVMELGKYVFGVFPVRSMATPSAYFTKNSLVIADAGDVQPSILVLKKFFGPEPLRADYTAFEVK